MFQGQNIQTTNMSYLGSQKLKEVASIFKYEYKMDIKYFSPTFCDVTKNVKSIVVIEDVTMLGSVAAVKNDSIYPNDFMGVQ